MDRKEEIYVGECEICKKDLFNTDVYVNFNGYLYCFECYKSKLN